MPSPMASLVNLESVGAAQRAALWARSTRGFFPGVSVRGLDGNPQAGRISSMPFGCGRIWSVLSPPLVVSYDPSSSNDDKNLFSVMIQLAGSTAARQQRRSCVLRAGDCCAIDNGAAFELEVPDEPSYLVFLQMPRLSVLGRHPYLARHTAELLDRDETGTRLLRGLLMNSLDSAATLENFQRAAALAAIIELLGASKLLHAEPVEETNWRVLSALQYVGARFADPRLNAEQVANAQGISRRRLDKLMVQAGGTTVAAQIWKRRLSQVAEELMDSRLAARSVAQIGFAAGFADPAHLSRTFRRTFHCTPGEWRKRKTGSRDVRAVNEPPSFRNQ